MIILPAIDIRGGQCVRLTEGRFDEETVYFSDPSLVAERFSWQGAEFLHVVDLDGAREGAGRNREVIKKVLAHASMPVELGGGIRDLNSIGELLNMGITRVILGSVAVKNPQLVKEACKEFADRVVIGIDAKDGMVAVEGWCEASTVTSEELGLRMREAGATRIIFTDISRDGKLSGVNVAATVKMAEVTGLQLIASGGVASLDDIKKLKDARCPGIEGCIIGKAIYTGAVDLREAIALAKEE